MLRNKEELPSTGALEMASPWGKHGHSRQCPLSSRECLVAELGFLTVAGVQQAQMNIQQPVLCCGPSAPATASSSHTRQPWRSLMSSFQVEEPSTSLLVASVPLPMLLVFAALTLSNIICFAPNIVCLSILDGSCQREGSMAILLHIVLSAKSSVCTQ